MTVQTAPDSHTECPECGTDLFNGQGLLACPECDWYDGDGGNWPGEVNAT